MPSPSPSQIAAWRFEQIAAFVDPSFDPGRRRAALAERTKRAIEWPLSETRERRGLAPLRAPIPRSTLYRWIRAYRAHGHSGLLPKTRRDKGARRGGEELERWVHFAIGLLLEQPQRSLFQLELYLRAEFEGYRLSRAGLARRLRAHPAFAGIKTLRAGKERRLRDLYEAAHPHESWQLDGKGPFRVHLSSGETVRGHVLSILDDHSRAILATIVARAEDTRAAIRVFCLAAAKYGLPDRMQFDRGSAFDSETFRAGLAHLGVHRNAVRARHPQAQGKIEAYHRALGRWFIEELAAQEVVDLAHLEQLLAALIALVYNRHHHRELQTSPEKKLAGRCSARTVSLSDLERAFFQETSAKSDKKTGAVKLPSGLFRVGVAHAGERTRFRYDLVHGQRAVLVTPDGREVELEPFHKKPLPPLATRASHGQGRLQKLLDTWQGKVRPNSEPSFGLPELFLELEKLLLRRVPGSEREALLVRSFYLEHGPFARAACLAACQKTRSALGEGRPLEAYLDDLVRQIRSQAASPATDPLEKDP